MEKEIFYFGRTHQFQPSQTLSFGDFEVIFREGELLYFRYQDEELIRRIYVAVRDRNWGTVPNRISISNFFKDAQSFSISFFAISEKDEIDFRWYGTITGESKDPRKGRLIFKMEGEAWSDFYKNRIGICVLLPASFAGKKVVCYKHPHFGGYMEKGRLPSAISPHQPFFDFSQLAVEIAPLSRLFLTFEGDIFEMEDQRNWSDASFKIYSTPLRYPFPVLVRRGERITQCVTVVFETKRTPLVSFETKQRSTCRILVDPVPTNQLPILGHNLNEGTEHFDRRTQQILCALKPSHLRVDVDTSLPLKNEEKKICQATAIAQTTNIPLWFALAVTSPQELERLFNVLPWEVTHRVLVSRNQPPWDTPKELVEETRRLMKKRNLLCLLGGGTKGWFAEFNRRPPFSEGIDFVFFSVSPQVHAFDNETLVENLPIQEILCKCAQKISKLPVVLSPITLSVHFNPNATEWGKRYTPPLPDPRQWSLFGMLWTLGSIKYASSAEALTYYEALGPRGVIPSPDVQEYWYRHGHQIFQVSPLAHIVKELGSKEKARVVPTKSTNPLIIDSLCLFEESECTLYVWNYSPYPQKASIEGLTFRIEQGFAFDEECFEELIKSPETNPRKWENFTQKAATIDLFLQPCSVVKLLGKPADS